jgi:hypothetical protein
VFKSLTMIVTVGGAALALAALARSAEPTLSVADLKAKGFVSPCKVLVTDEHGPQELLRNVVQGPNAVWTLANYSCGADDGTVPKGLWFQDFNQPAFHLVATYTKDLEVSGNATGDWLLFVNEPSNGESNAFLLPVSAFNGPGRVALPDLPGSQVNFQDLSPTGYVDLAALSKALIPAKYDGRVMMQAAWQEDGKVGLFLYARNQAEDDTWTGCATYAVPDAKLAAINHLPFQGLDWIGNLKVTESNSHIDLQ